MARAEDAAVRLAVALLLARSAAAQNTNTNAPATTAAAPPNTQTTATNNQQTTTGNAQQTNAPQSTNTGQSTNAGTTPADKGSSVAITGIPTASTKTSSGTGVSSFGLSDLPTIAGYGIPTQVIPWTKGAPFMQQSNLPEGTVFIVVGAFLAFLGIAILAWRGLVAWSIHRSVKRANEKLLHQPESVKLVKPGYGGAASLANQSNMSIGQANMSMDRLAGSNTLTKKSTTPARSNIASVTAASRNSSLFFSPTAGSGHPGNTSSTFLPANRSSSYLPSGYYSAPGAAAPASGAAGTHIGTGSSNRYSRHSRYHDVSPPASPGLPPSSRGVDSRGGGSHGMYQQPSTSSLNLNIPGNAHPGGRAPSANLDDMLGDYPLPNAR